MKVRPIHVLLVDDDKDDFVIIRDLLQEAKENEYKLDWVVDFDAALEKIAARARDVYLIDFRLGSRTGFDLIREAQQRGNRGPMILLTGLNDRDADLEAMKLGAADYLEKSEISSYLLERSIRYAIYRTHMREQAVSHERMASIGLLASSLAHEIGTPLGVIRGRAEYLAIQVGEDEAIKKNVNVILSQIDRVSHLIRSLLNLARGDHTEQVGSVSVNRAISDVLDLVAHELRKSNIEVINEIGADDQVHVIGQSQKLHQVLLNIVINSIHAIKSEKADGREEGHFIRFSARDLGARWSISVEDTGCGISSDHLPNIFRPFYTTKQDVGTGLGLATSLWIVQSWGGSMDIESREGEGTKVYMSIPKAP